MTLDDLKQIFDKGKHEAWAGLHEDDKAPTAADEDRAGIAAVVRALRESFIEAYLAGRDEEKPYGQIARGAESFVSDLLNEILGDAGDEVAGVIGLDPVGAGLSPASGQAPATDPAPAVCEWTPQRSLPDWRLTSCGMVCTEQSNRNGKCQSCGKPIKFTEAK